jgi:hypothetical protein
MPFQVESSKTFGNPQTARNYKNRLNKLSAFGYETKDDIVANPVGVVNAIYQLTESVSGTDRKKQARRFFFSAVFYALHDTDYIKTPSNPLRSAFHENDPTETFEGQPWRRVSEYKSYAIVE